jgi:hypothetical protein
LEKAIGKVYEKMKIEHGIVSEPLSPKEDTGTTTDEEVPVISNRSRDA